MPSLQHATDGQSFRSPHKHRTTSAEGKETSGATVGRKEQNFKIFEMALPLERP